MNIDELLARLDNIGPEEVLTDISAHYRLVDQAAAAIRQLRGSVEPDVVGEWGKYDLRRAFVDGMKWWQATLNGATAFPSEVDLAEEEAQKRYLHPQPAQEPVAKFTLEDGCLTGSTLRSGLTGEFLVYEKPLHPQPGVVVPEEATRKMADAGLAAWSTGTIFDMWKAMLASRPSQGAQNAEDK